MQHPFPRMSYAYAMATYGSDKPDTRFGMELQSLPEIAASAVGLIVRSSRPWRAKATDSLCDRFGMDRMKHVATTIRISDDGKFRSSMKLTKSFATVSRALDRIGARYLTPVHLTCDWKNKCEFV